MILNDQVKQSIMKLYEELNREGELLSKSKLDKCYEAFRQKFGPEKLKRLDGEVLLNTMHDFNDKDNSLVYWLEFKNDEEFPAHFGSIAGGSALKYGIYKNKDKGTWVTGSPQAQTEITVTEAINIARQHRDDLIKATELLERLPINANDNLYQQLQVDIDKSAPSISDTSWGHKYLNLIYPDKLDDYHNAEYQRFHLIKLLQAPPEGNGRFVCAGRFIAIANELGIPINSLTSITNYRDGDPHNYWRIGTSEGDTGKSHWAEMRDSEYVSVGWSALGDLSDIQYNRESKAKLRSLIEKHYPNSNSSVIGRATQQLFNFIAGLRDNDILVAADGATILGIAKINGDYRYDNTNRFGHIRPVKWLSLKDWKLPVTEGLLTTFHSIKAPKNLIEIERLILNAEPISITGKTDGKPIELPALGDIPDQMRSILERKGQVIVYGPPGTGKTYWAMRTAEELAARLNFNLPYDKLDGAQKSQVSGSIENIHPMVRFCCFHPSYGYEDFLEGHKPILTNNQVGFQLKDGIFKNICEDAIKNGQYNYYLIIDEINRGDIPRIFGELITLLEKDKRGKNLILPLSGKAFQIPKNVFIIGTMNTADRSIALIDTALRRRFGFLSLMPDISTLGNASIEGVPLGPWLSSLNQRILQFVNRDARDLQIGHAYFLENGKPVNNMSNFIKIFSQDIIPLLEEYCYEDFATLAKILGNNLVNVEKQQINYSLFEESKRGEFIQAISNPEISTSNQAIDIEKNVVEEKAEEIGEEAENLTEKR